MRPRQWKYYQAVYVLHWAPSIAWGMCSEWGQNHSGDKLGNKLGRSCTNISESCLRASYIFLQLRIQYCLCYAVLFSCHWKREKKKVEGTYGAFGFPWNLELGRIELDSDPVMSRKSKMDACIAVVSRFLGFFFGQYQPRTAQYLIVCARKQCNNRYMLQNTVFPTDLMLQKQTNLVKNTA